METPAVGILERRVDLSKIDFLSQHKVRGVPTLPGAWILDLMVTAGLELPQDAAPIAAVTVRDAAFHRFVRCTGNGAISVLLRKWPATGSPFG